MSPPGLMLLGKSWEKLLRARKSMKQLDQSRNNAPLWMYLVMKVKSSAAKDSCIGTWNVRSMNQDKLDVVKQEMVRINIYILEISELKWTVMGEFNSEDHYIYYSGQESLRRNGVALIINKRAQNAVFGCNLKNYRMISVRFQGKPFNVRVIQIHALTTDAKEAEIYKFYEDQRWVR